MKTIRTTDPRRSLLRMLQTSPPDEERLLAKIQDKSESGNSIYSSLLYLLTHLSFSEAEARRHWKRIVAHRDRLRKRLGRDCGLRVALLDYFVNVSHELRNPKVIEIAIYERTERSAAVDGLTGLYNHAHFLSALEREIKRARRAKTVVSLGMFDLDDFKQINDTFGHVAGNRVLEKAAALIKESLRDVDIAARYGGEEFVVMLPDTQRAGAFVVAERIRRRIEDHFKRSPTTTRVTVSGGVASFPEDAEGFADLIRRADEGLYRSKAEGKNRITLIGGERRQHPRIPARHPVLVDDARSKRVRSENVSQGGFLVNLKQAIPLGTPLSIIIRPKGSSPLALRGEVVRVVPREKGAYDVGVRFLKTSAEELLVLKGLEGKVAAS